MNSDTDYPSSSKRRSNNRGEESGMDSSHNARGSKAEPMRVAAMRPTDSKFRVAEREDGGTAQDNHPSFFLSAAHTFFFYNCNPSFMIVQ